MTLFEGRKDLNQSAQGDSNVQVGENNGTLNVSFSSQRAQPVYLVAVIQQLADTVPEDPPQARCLAPFDPSEKIAFNKIDRYRTFIEGQATEFYRVEQAYDALAKAAYPHAKVKLDRHLRSRYQSLRAANPALTSDDIFEQILNESKTRAEDVAHVPLEDIGPACDLIIAHAFVECVILEKPPNAG